MVWSYVTEWAFQTIRQTGWISKRKEEIRPTSASCDCVFVVSHPYLVSCLLYQGALSVHNAAQVQGYYIKVSIHTFQRCGCLTKCFVSKVNFSPLGGVAVFIPVWRQRWLQPQWVLCGAQAHNCRINRWMPPLHPPFLEQMQWEVVWNLTLHRETLFQFMLLHLTVYFKRPDVVTNWNSAWIFPVDCALF